MASLPEVSTAENWCKTHTNVVSFSYKWIITNFSKRPTPEDVVMKSSTFSDGQYNEIGWCLQLYPKKIINFYNYVGLFLKLETIKNSTSGNVDANYKFSLLNNKNEERNTRSIEGVRFALGSSNGTNEFIFRSDLLNKATGLLPDDTLTIICQITTTFDTVTSFPQKGVPTEPDCEHKLIEDLGHLFENATLKDVTLIVENCEIEAHKVIMATRSTVFDAMFKHELEESKSNRISIADIRFEVVHEMLRFMYTGKVLNLTTMADELLIAADKYAITDLRALCELKLCSKLTVETSAEMLILAELHGAGNLKAQAIEFINAHTTKVFKTQGWKNMMASHKDLVMETVEAIATWNGPPRKLTKN